MNARSMEHRLEEICALHGVFTANDVYDTCIDYKLRWVRSYRSIYTSIRSAPYTRELGMEVNRVVYQYVGDLEVAPKTREKYQRRIRLDNGDVYLSLIHI